MFSRKIVADDIANLRSVAEYERQQLQRVNNERVYWIRGQEVVDLIKRAVPFSMRPEVPVGVYTMDMLSGLGRAADEGVRVAVLNIGAHFVSVIMERRSALVVDSVSPTLVNPIIVCSLQSIFTKGLKVITTGLQKEKPAKTCGVHSAFNVTDILMNYQTPVDSAKISDQLRRKEGWYHFFEKAAYVPQS